MSKLPVMLTIVVLAATSIVCADGIDDPKFYKEDIPTDVTRENRKDKNFYNDFSYCFESKLNNAAGICRKYDFMGPFTWRDDRVTPGNSGKIILIPYRETEHFRVRENVPEPMELLLLTVGISGLCIWRKFK